MKNVIFILFLCLNFSMYGQDIRFEKAINYIKKDFKNKGTERYFKEILDPNAYGISIYESIFPIYKSDSYINWLNIEKSKPIKKNSSLAKLNKKYWIKSWKLSDYYKNKNVFTKDKFKGPSHIAVFNELKNDSLRVDFLSNSREGLKYCGSVNKYLFIFDEKDSIKEVKTWIDHYECM